MELKRGTMIELDGINCCVLDTQVIKDNTYIYVSEIKDDDITENFYVYKVDTQGKFDKVENSDELKEVLPVFIKSMNNYLEI